MIKALAPTMPRGCWWLLLSIVLTIGLPWAVRAQTREKAADPAKPSTKSNGPSGKEAPKSDAAKKDEPAPAKNEEPAGEVEDEKAPGIEIFKDKRAEDALKVEIRPVGKPTNDTTIRQVKSMAGGASNPDRETMRKFVDGMTYQLTNANNIKALIDPTTTNPASSAARAVKEATNDLLDPIYTAKATNNEAFLTMYGQVLIEKLPPLLKSHLIPRIEAMIVLGQLGSPGAMDIYTKQLTDRDQTVWVKLWAARGIDNASLHGRREVQQGLASAKALAVLLREKDLPWPVQMRALEALGSLRIAADPSAPSKAEMASAAMGFLADPDARFEVRATAAWALGMMRGTSAIPQFNYRLVAYHIGQVAADLGEEVADAFDDDKVRAEYWTGVLLNPIFHGLYGETEARDSGLLKTSSNQSAVKQVADLVRPIVEKSILLLRTPGGNAEKVKQDLSAQIAALKGFLEKNPPSDARLVPGGDKFPLKKDQVAQAPAGNGRVVDVPGGQ